MISIMTTTIRQRFFCTSSFNCGCLITSMKTSQCLFCCTLLPPSVTLKHNMWLHVTAGHNGCTCVPVFALDRVPAWTSSSRQWMKSLKLTSSPESRRSVTSDTQKQAHVINLHNIMPALLTNLNKWTDRGKSVTKVLTKDNGRKSQAWIWAVFSFTLWSQCVSSVINHWLTTTKLLSHRKELNRQTQFKCGHTNGMLWKWVYCLSSFQVEDYFNSIPQRVTNDTKEVVQSEWAHLRS